MTHIDLVGPVIYRLLHLHPLLNTFVSSVESRPASTAPDEYEVVVKIARRGALPDLESVLLTTFMRVREEADAFLVKVERDYAEAVTQALTPKPSDTERSRYAPPPEDSSPDSVTAVEVPLSPAMTKVSRRHPKGDL